MAWEDLAGKKFSRLLVLSHSHRTADRVHHWVCRCDCGEERVVSGKNLRNGNSKSCGCVHGIAISDPITHEQLLRLIRYDPETGNFWWVVTGRAFTKDTLTGYIPQHGTSAKKANPYVRINLNGKFYSGQRLAWFYMTGEWPEFEIDHEDTDTKNNRWNNLRPATRLQNSGNSNLSVASKTGFKGVTVRRGRYRVTIAGRDVGYFDSPIEAAKTYDRFARERYGQYARTNFGTE